MSVYLGQENFPAFNGMQNSHKCFAILSAEYRSMIGFVSSIGKLPADCCILLQKQATSCSVCGSSNTA